MNIIYFLSRHTSIRPVDMHIKNYKRSDNVKNINLAYLYDVIRICNTYDVFKSLPKIEWCIF